MSVDLENRYPHTFAIQLGADVIDSITGFGGVVTASSNYLTGCDRYSVLPRELKDGHPQDAHYLEEYRLTYQQHQDGEVVLATATSDSQAIQFAFDNGEYVKDLVTGFVGIVVVRTATLRSDNRYAVVNPNPKNMKDDREWLYFDEAQLQRTKQNQKVELNPITSGKPGGPPVVEAPRH